MKYVQFTDSSETEVMSIFSCAQDPDDYPNQGLVEGDDPRYLAYMNPQSTPAAILQAKKDQKDALLAAASQSMAPILVSLQLGDATDEETVTARAWQAYYRALKLLDITVETTDWPAPPAQ